MIFVSSNRFVTAEVAATIGPDIQYALWKLIDDKKQAGAVLDYLQIFELSPDYAFGEIFQKVTHRQEVPPDKKDWYYRAIISPVNATIWVIDSGDYATMLYPHEY